MKGLPNPWRHPEAPWVFTGGIVLVLALMDRFFIENQSGSIDSLLDWSTISVAIIGSCYSWVVSYRAPLRTTIAQNVLLTIRILGCWLVGPFVVLGTACLAHDIDGGLLLFYPPFLGILLTLFVLPSLLARRLGGLPKPDPKLTSTQRPTASGGHENP
jgi:hypothetical protein